MLIDFENIGYVKCDNVLLPTESSYIPASTWGFIKGDITEQKDLLNLITNLEVGLTPEQIQMLSNAEIRLDNLENILETLDTETITNTLNGVKIELNRKAYKDEVYTKSEIDNKGYLTEHQSLADYATTEWVSTQLNGYITTEQLTDNVYNKSEIDNIISNIEIGDFDLTNYVTKDYLAEQNFATEQFVVNQGYIDIYTNRLINYYTKSEIDDKSYLTQDNLQDYVTYKTDRLSNYYKKTDVYTKSEIESKGYLTKHQSLADYYNKSEIDNIVNNIDVDLTGYATEQWVEDKGYLTEHQSLADYATKQWVLYNYYLKGDVDELLNDTKDWVTEQGYLTEHQDLTGYVTETWVSNQNYLTQLSLEDYVTFRTERLSNYYLKSETDEMLANKLDTNLIWSGSQSEWDALTADAQAQYIIAMIQQ